MILLPPPPRPVGFYEAGVIRGSVGFVSGQFPLRNGVLVCHGQVGANLTIKEACDACELAALNVLAQISDLTEKFATLDGLLRLDGYVASADGFLDQPKVLDAASALFREVLGDRGRHARTAFSVRQLPMGSPIELGMSFVVRSPKGVTGISGGAEAARSDHDRY